MEGYFSSISSTIKKSEDVILLTKKQLKEHLSAYPVSIKDIIIDYLEYFHEDEQNIVAIRISPHIKYNTIVRKDNTLYKISLSSDMEDEIRKKLEGYDYFKFWTLNKETKSFLVDNILIDCSNKIISKTIYAGVTLESLFKDRQMSITGDHLIKIIVRIVEALQILSMNHYVHNDLFCRNIIIQPTEEEYKQGYISKTLAYLIDFDHSRSSSHAEQENINSLIWWIKMSLHGRDIIEEIGDSWIMKALKLEDELDFQRKITPFLQALGDPQKVTLKMLRDMLIKQT